jgi:ribosomal protein S18 acetylase RimI-like enzyme
MNTIIYSRLDNDNFKEFSLDKFVRHQQVKECWRNIDGEWKLIHNEFTEEWTLKKCRAVAGNITSNLREGLEAFGAFDGDVLIAYITVGKKFFGSQKQYVELIEFQVSEPYRRQGIGKQLFELVCGAARDMGAKKLYISAHSSKESQAAYRKLGCKLVEEINQVIAEKEPCDV